MDQRRFMGGRVKGTQLAAAAFVLSLVLLLAVGGITVFVLAHKTTNNADFAKELRDAQVQNCEDSGNPLREAEIEDLNEGIEDQNESIVSVDDPRLPQLFPNVAPGVIEELVHEGNQKARRKIAKKEERLTKIQPVNCSDKYP
jgi:hypothetical protein